MRLLEEQRSVTIDEMLAYVGEYGRFQKLVNFILCLITLASIYHVMIMYFAADDPNWRCVSNSTECFYNGTFNANDDRRCTMSRSEWEYAASKDYSIVTFFDIHCDQRWQLELLTSILFLGWILGSFVLGWFCDNYGRKLILLVSMNVVMIAGLICVFLPSIYYIIACRFVIGFFLPGTMIQCFIIMTEIVGSNYRPFAGLIVFTAATLSTTILGVKAYFIRNWKLLHIACTAPYLFLVLFYKFLPESIRYLRVKGEMDKLMHCFHRIAYWNKTNIPSDIHIFPPPIEALNHKSSPSSLFRTAKIARKTTIQIFAYFTTGLVYFGVFLAARDMSGYMYRDYIIIAVWEIPVNFVSIDFCERFGRKKTTMIPMIVSSFACIALSFTPRVGELKIARVITGLIGKCFIGSVMNTLCTWSTELYTTQVRGEAMGLFQGFIRLGAASAPWFDKEIVKIHKSASFLFMAATALLSFCLMGFLPETKGTVTKDTEEDTRIKETPKPLKFMLNSNDLGSLVRGSFNGYTRLHGMERPYSRSCIEF